MGFLTMIDPRDEDDPYDNPAYVILDPPNLESVADCEAWLEELAEMRRVEGGHLVWARVITEAEEDARREIRRIRNWEARQDARARGDREAYIVALMEDDLFTRAEAEEIATEHGLKREGD